MAPHMVVDPAVTVAQLVQVLSVEVSSECNLARQHPACPCSLGHDRYLTLARRLDEPTIVDWVQSFYERGFRGWVNFSYYNEPLIALDLVRRVRELLARSTPGLRFWLITNGTLLPDDLTVLAGFDMVHITDYGGDASPSGEKLLALQQLIGAYRTTNGHGPRGLLVTKGRLDRRMSPSVGRILDRPCVVPFRDLAVDHGGTIHLCCYDWRGEVKLGNLFTDPLGHICSRWLAAVEALTGPVGVDAPMTCRTCRYASQRLERTDPDAARRTMEWLVARRTHG